MCICDLELFQEEYIITLVLTNSAVICKRFDNIKLMLIPIFVSHNKTYQLVF